MSKDTALLWSNQALDEDLSLIFQQRYAKPSTDYWGVFTPTERERQFSLGELSPQFTTKNLENSSSLLPDLLSHILPVSPQFDPPPDVRTVLSKDLEEGSSLGVQRQNFNSVPWSVNGGDGAVDSEIPAHVTNNAQQQSALPASLPQADQIEVRLPLETNNSPVRETQIKRQRAGSGVKIRRFCAQTIRPRKNAGVQAIGWPVATVFREGQQLLQQYHHQAPCNDLAEVRVLESEAEQRRIMGMDEWYLNSAADAGLQLVHLLLACAEAVDNLQFNLVHVLLMRLRVLIEPRSNTMQRLAAIFVTALTARITRTAEGGLYMGYHKDDSIPVSESLKYFGVVYNYTPLGKFPHVILNQIILDAVEKDSSIHIIDLNTEWRGMQWPAFIHALAMRPGAAPRLRITALGRAADLSHAQKKLHMFAQNMQFSLEFCPIVVDLKDFDLSMLDIREDEAICINCFSTLHQFLAAEDSQVHKFFCDLKSLNPRVFVISDNDTDHNSPSFLHRFVECLKYYSAVFDALDASIPDRESLLEIEQLFAGQKIRNIIACEGNARIERHENMASWNRRLLAAGFQRCPIAARVVNHASLQLTMYYVDGFTLSIKEGYVGLGWKNMPLVGIAAWCTNHCEPHQNQQSIP
ncbi:hypothetical protein KC19_11G137400 [Ceratodon purpureus]|uniref:Uncharacterized protein n=1 Tax=Ceratodon purpureus TaxID=3225 RepID=A0A8T0GGT5_CERPU|nr:hypothetical protein KC19_11G137400 [Ceratodon purpureus]KAG0557524.1 hypothetical protein KC19_11G137400 [Ceratodon purpureus]